MSVEVPLPDGEIRYSVVVPVYGNAATLPEVIERLERLDRELGGGLEGVFVVDGSPDDSLAVLRKLLPDAAIPSQLVAHSRNFGSFPAIRTGLGVCRGEYVAAMAADLQEPASLILDFFQTLRTGEYDVVVGSRTKRQDPFLSSVLARAFWALYRRMVHRAIPPGGVDIFGCTPHGGGAPGRRSRSRTPAWSACSTGSATAGSRSPTSGRSGRRARAAGRCVASTATSSTASTRSPTSRSRCWSLIGAVGCPAHHHGLRRHGGRPAGRPHRRSPATRR